MDEPRFMKFCNGCGKFYVTNDPSQQYVFDTNDDEVGVLEFCTKECYDKFIDQVPHH
jgi:hypothetical protein